MSYAGVSISSLPFQDAAWLRAWSSVLEARMLKVMREKSSRSVASGLANRSRMIRARSALASTA